jgi:hypothetical protein
MFCAGRGLQPRSQRLLCCAGRGLQPRPQRFSERRYARFNVTDGVANPVRQRSTQDLTLRTGLQTPSGSGFNVTDGVANPVRQRRFNVTDGVANPVRQRI